jgi:hypothetical protein
MTLTSTMANRRGRTRRATRVELSVDVIVLAAAAGLCALLFFQKGGLEALLSAAAGGLIAERRVSGALAGLWIGMLFAGFFHGALAALIAPLF